MKAHMAAITTRLASPTTAAKAWAIGFTTTAQTMPYGIVSAPAWGSPDDMPLCGESAELDVEFRVKAVGVSANDVYTILAQARAALSPSLGWAPLTVTGRSAQTKFVRSEFVGPDISVTLPSSNTHPVQGVDTYRLVSQPTG